MRRRKAKAAARLAKMRGRRPKAGKPNAEQKRARLTIAREFQ